MDTFEILNLAKVPQDYLSTESLIFIEENLNPQFIDFSEDISINMQEKIYYTTDLPKDCEIDQIKKIREVLDNQNADYFLIAQI